MKNCWTCKYYFYDWATDASECKKADDLTESQFETHFVMDKPNCQCWAQIEEYKGGIYE